MNKQRREKSRLDQGLPSTMTTRRAAKLEAVGFEWATPRGQIHWDQRFRELLDFFAQHGHCLVPTKSPSHRALGRWVSSQRARYKDFQAGKLRASEESIVLHRIALLNEIGFVWDLKKPREEASVPMIPI